MQPKPRHLGPEYAAIFQDKEVVAAYDCRPPYPREPIAALAALAGRASGRVLDIGCGTGDIARPLAPLVEGIDAIDVSLGMIERGRRLPGGSHSQLTWIHSPIETATPAPPYALITAGESLHWMDWEIVFPRFARALTPDGMLAMIGRDWNGPPALWARLLPIVQRYSTNRDFQPYDLIDELTQRGLFEQTGENRTRTPWRPTVDEYIECRHSQNGLSRRRMAAQAAPFDAEVRGELEAMVRDGSIQRRGGRLDLAVEATTVWGKPISPSS